MSEVQWYDLDADHNPVPVSFEQMLEMEQRPRLWRRVCWTAVGDVKVSTVFLMLDHQYGDGPPLLFETMVFGGKLDQEQVRYSTWDEACVGHVEMVKRVEEAELA